VFPCHQSNSTVIFCCARCRHTDGEFRRHLSPLQARHPPSPQSSTTGSSSLVAGLTSAAVDPASRMRLLSPPSVFSSHAAAPSPAPSDMSSLSELAADDANEATVSELTPMLPVVGEVTQTSLIAQCTAGWRYQNDINQRRTPTNQPTPTATFEQWQSQMAQVASAETELRHQTVVVEVYQPKGLVGGRVRRPMSLHWNRQQVGTSCNGEQTGNHSIVLSTSHSRSAPELRLSTDDKTGWNTKTAAAAATAAATSTKASTTAAVPTLIVDGNTATSSDGNGTRVATGPRINDRFVNLGSNVHQLPTTFTRERRVAVSMPSLSPSPSSSSCAHRSSFKSSPPQSTNHRLVVLSLPEISKIASVAGSSLSSRAVAELPICSAVPMPVPLPVSQPPQSSATNENRQSVPREPASNTDERSASHPLTSDVVDAHLTDAVIPVGRTAVVISSPSSSAMTATATTGSTDEGANWREASKELWNLRAMLANRGDDCSIDESVDDDPASAATATTTATTTPQSADDASAKSSDTVVSVIDADGSHPTNASPADDVPSASAVAAAAFDKSADSSSNSSESTARPESEASSVAAATATMPSNAGNAAVSASPLPEDDGLRRVPSVRRQTYRNAIARRQQQKNQQQFEAAAAAADETVGCSSACQTEAGRPVAAPAASVVECGRLVPPVPGDASSEVTDTESSLSFERYFGAGGYSASISAAASSIDTSFRDSITSNDSVGGGGARQLQRGTRQQRDAPTRASARRQRLSVARGATVARRRCRCRRLFGFFWHRRLRRHRIAARHATAIGGGSTGGSYPRRRT
jgi:hypothetical protein